MLLHIITILAVSVGGIVTEEPLLSCNPDSPYSYTYEYQGEIIDAYRSGDWAVEIAIPIHDLTAADEPIMGYIVQLDELSTEQAGVSEDLDEDMPPILFLWGNRNYLDICHFEEMLPKLGVNFDLWP